MNNTRDKQLVGTIQNAEHEIKISKRAVTEQCFGSCFFFSVTCYNMRISSILVTLFIYVCN